MDLSNLPATLQSSIRHPKHRGGLFKEEALDRGLTYFEARSGQLKLFLLFGQNDVVQEVKFFSYGAPILTAVGEAICQLFADAEFSDIEMTADSYFDMVMDYYDYPAGKEAFISIRDEITKDYMDRKKSQEVERALREQFKDVKWEPYTEQDKSWVAKSKEDRLKDINYVIDTHARKFLQNDSGDIEIQDLVDEVKVVAEYKGTCETCPSSIGSTLNMIVRHLREHCHPDLTLEPKVNLVST